MTTAPGDHEQALSALVILRPPGEGPVVDRLTADRVHQLIPSPSVVQTVTEWFASRGFDVGEAVGISFALTGPRSLFEDTFHLPAGRPGYEPLGLDALPQDVARHISTITFAPPPEFGPDNP
ncbi:hypothetical protein [Wenjunlia tyrosinilytica]|uniref:Uncharacterized protein n=1 Tax=Wenjunlia tyrosinilytica TaxID=1544741 RepID=A0A917ZT17_9ACTN|nr:hypothetical protein [Wenjunlia tyrosinilytica]GGO91880.1 hypothetical protein GCM10012280_40780 [Wenjunlia tyrosinilytica]